MRNPLHFSSALLVKRAGAQPPILNIPAYTARPGDGAAPAMSDDQISGLLQNIQSYPEEQQQKMLDSINKDYGNSSYRGGLVGKMFGNIGNYASSLGNSLQQGANWASEGLFGAKPFDTQDSDRYRAETVLRSAAKNPEMYKRVTDRLNTATAPTATPAPAVPTPAATPTAAQPAPIPKFDINQLTTVAPGMRGPLRPQTPTPAAVTPTAPTPVTPTPPVAQPAAPAPAVMQNTIASSAGGSVLNKPTAPVAPTPAPTPAPRKEGLIEGIPASQWIAQNKARQAQESTGYNSKVQAMNPTMAAASGQVYNPVAGRMVPRGFNPYK